MSTAKEDSLALIAELEKVATRLEEEIEKESSYLKSHSEDRRFNKLMDIANLKRTTEATEAYNAELADAQRHRKAMEVATVDETIARIKHYNNWEQLQSVHNQNMKKMTDNFYGNLLNTIGCGLNQIADAIRSLKD